MKTFKFLSNKPTTPRGRIWGGLNVGGMTFENGDTIIRTNTFHPHNQSEISSGSIPFTIWWKDNYEYFEQLNERRVGINIIESYEGTIGRFMETYNHRRRTFRQWYYSIYPVFTQIECNGCTYYADDIHFSNNDMWIRIRYLIFVNR